MADFQNAAQISTQLRAIQLSACRFELLISRATLE